MIQLIIADDDDQVRSAIRLLVEHELTSWQVAGEARNAIELMKCVNSNQADLILLDWELPTQGLCAENGIPVSFQRCMQKLKTANPDLSVVVMSCIPEVRSEVLASGADAFVAKTDPPEVLLGTMYACCPP
jgi:DNA-binding NarL/FixJ family response regulator